MNSSRIGVLIPLVIGISLIAALYVGSLVAEGSYFHLGLCAAFVGFFLYALILNKYWILLALLFSVLAFRIQPIGPALDGEHLAALLGIGFVFSNFWKKKSPVPGEKLLSESFAFFNRAFVFFSLFLILHSFVTYYYPSPEITVGFGNLAKQYFSFWGPFFIVWNTVNYIRFIPPLKNLPSIVGWILLLGLICNISLRTYSTFFLGVGERDPITGEVMAASALYIPVLNLTDNIYALRGLSPLAALYGVTMLTSKNRQLKSSGQAFLWALLFLLGIIGSVLSMGRATMLITGLLVITCLLIRRQLAAVAIIFLMFLGIIVSARFVYEADKKLVPFGIQRSLAMIPGMDMPEAKGDIDASSEWRWILATKALDEWQSNARKFLIGRGVHAFTDRDLMVAKLQGYFGSMEVSLRRGATHNAVTDLLITVGLVGTILYIPLLTGYIISMIKVQKRLEKNGLAVNDMIFVALLFSVAMLPVFILGGGGVFNIVVFILCASLVNICAQEPIKHQEFEV